MVFFSGFVGAEEKRRQVGLFLAADSVFNWLGVLCFALLIAAAQVGAQGLGQARLFFRRFGFLLGRFATAGFLIIAHGVKLRRVARKLKGKIANYFEIFCKCQRMRC